MHSTAERALLPHLLLSFSAAANGFVYVFSYGMISDDDPIRYVANQVEWTLDIIPLKPRA